MRWWTGVVVLLAAGVGSAAPVDPSGPGRFAVGVTSVDLVDTDRDNRVIRTEIWYPGRSAVRDAPFVKRRFPLIVFVHGNCGSRDNYEYLTTHLAGHGFVVAAPDIRGYFAGDCNPSASGTPRRDDPWRDLSFVRAAFHDRRSPLAPFRRLVRGQRTGLAGHSLGGVWAQQAMLADARFTAVALLATLPVQDDIVVPAPSRATVVLGATDDDLLPYEDFSLPLFQALAAPTFLVKVVGGTHSGFTDVDANLAPGSLQRQQAIVRRYVTALFLWALAGRRSAVRYLTPEDAQQFGDDLALTARRHAPAR